MKLAIVKLDRRYKAHPHFHYYVEPTGWPKGNNYLELREWCWAQYGPGCHVDMRTAYHVPEAAEKYKWVWHDEELRLYFKDGPELSHLRLAWA